MIVSTSERSARRGRTRRGRTCCGRRARRCAGRGDERPLDGGLGEVRGGQSVLDADAVGAERTRRRRRCRPARAPPSCRRRRASGRGPVPPTRCSVMFGPRRPAPSAIGSAWVTTVSSPVRRQQLGEPDGGGAGVDDDRRRRRAAGRAPPWRSAPSRRRTGASRSATPGSMPSRSTGMAPPCTRRSSPCRSRTVRSRRMVSGVTSRSSASRLTSTRPSARAWPRIACCRSGAYTSTPSSCAPALTPASTSSRVRPITPPCQDIRTYSAVFKC